jgi:hypothetical protein
MTNKWTFKKFTNTEFGCTRGNPFSFGKYECRLKYTGLKVDIALYCDD